MLNGMEIKYLTQKKEKRKEKETQTKDFLLVITPYQGRNYPVHSIYVKTTTT